MLIDAHHHLWKYSAAEYGWITPQMRVIRRDFLPPQLEELMHHFGIEGTVAVQARQTLEETSWLLSLSEQHPLIHGVVGWVPLTEGTGVKPHLERFAANRRLRGVRHVIHDEPDPRYILRDDFNAGVAALPEFGLRYDILIFEKHLPAAIEFVDRHPNQIFILDHIAKPRIKERILSPWDSNMREMAKRQNVYCKLSGMVTEADLEHWTPQRSRALYRCRPSNVRTAPYHVRIRLAGAATCGRLRTMVRCSEQRNRQTVEGRAGPDHGRHRGGSVRALSNNVFHNISVNIGEPEIATRVAIGQLGVIHPQQIQNGRV